MNLLSARELGRDRKVSYARGATAMIIAVTAIAGTGILSQTRAENRDMLRYPPPGLLVDVGDFRLHMRQMGAGKPGPTVVFESGLGTASPIWFPIQDQVAQFASVVAYDRAGIGWSEAGPGPRDALHIARELHTLLNRQGVPRPYVLVSHSIGALYSRVYAGLYPDEVAGMVLVDPCHPKQLERLPATDAEGQLAWFRTIEREPALARFGITRLLHRGEAPPPGLPEQDAAPLRALGLSVRHLESVAAEAAQWNTSASQAEAVTHLGPGPLVVLSSTRPANEGQRAWIQLHRELATLAPLGIHREVLGADHMSLLAQPEHAAATVAAIRELMDRIAGRK